MVNRMRLRDVSSMKRPVLSSQQVHDFVSSVAGDDLHAQRVLSLANATVGVVHAAALGVSAIGRALAQVQSLKPKHAIKQVDRLLSNSGLDVWRWFESWVPYIVGARKEAIMVLDWTEFDADDQATLSLQMMTDHGRTTPLMWLTVRKSELLDQRNQHEDRLLMRLREVLPADLNPTILADRGFGDTKLYALMTELRFDYVIRFRGVIKVTDAEGTQKPAADWVPSNGRTKMLTGVEVTSKNMPVPAVVLKKAKGMKEAWCLATSRTDLTGAKIVDLYSKRFRIEESFRDTKDIHFGMGLSSTRIRSPERRDRLLLISALAIALITLLGAAGEAVGLDRGLKANTVKRRTHSLFFQGVYYYGALPNMKAPQFEAIVAKFGELVQAQRIFREVFGVI